MVSGISGLPPYAAFQNFIEDPNAQIDKFRETDVGVQRDIEYFQDNIGKVETVDDLLDDYRLSRFVLSAFGLQDEVLNKGRVKKVLSENPTDPESLVNKLADSKFKEMAQALRLDTPTGLIRLRNNEDFQADLIDKFVRNEFEVDLGEQSAELREAVTFARTIGETNNVFGILGDRILRSVVQGALQIPEELAIQPIETQARAIESRLEVEKFFEDDDINLSQEDIDAARSDQSLIESNLQVTEAAITQVDFISSQIETVLDGLSTLDDDTDPGGTNSADIAAQQTAIPDLLRFEELIQAAQEYLGNTGLNLSELDSLVDQASVSGADLADLKSQFSSVVAEIKAEIDNAEITTVEGTTENLLLAGSDGTQSTVVDGDGNTISITQFDMEDFKTLLDNAESAFNAVTGENDIANLSTTRARISFAVERKEEVEETLSSDLSDFDSAVAEVDFFAALNTDDLRLAFRSVRDAQTRLIDIETKLGEIQDLAEESAARTSTADRSDLETSFNTLRDEIRSLIENTNDSGLVNFINNAPNQSFNVIAGADIEVTGGFDLATTISDVLDGEDISTQSGAQALETQAITLTNRTDEAQLSLGDDEVLINRAFTQYDPQGIYESIILDIEDALPLLVDGAASNGVNLLDSEQSDITVNLQTAFFDIVLGAQNDFESDTDSALDSAIDQLGVDLDAFQSLLLDLQINVERASRLIKSDANLLNLEAGKVGATLDVLDQQEAEDAENPYKTNNFTLKFIERFLILNTSSEFSISADAAASSAGIALGLLTGASSGTGTEDAINEIGSLINQLG